MHNQNRIIKIRKSTLICYYKLTLRHIQILPDISKMSFIAKGSSSESWVVFHWQIFSCPSLCSVPVFFFDFHYLDTSEDYRSITLYCASWFAFVSCFSIIRFKCYILSGISQRWCCVLIADLLSDTESLFFYFDHLNEMMSAMFLYCKVIFFLFVTNNYCWKEIWSYVYNPFVM